MSHKVVNKLLSGRYVHVPKGNWIGQVRKFALRLARPQFGGIDLHDLDEHHWAIPLTAIYVTSLIIVFSCLLYTFTYQAANTSFLSLESQLSGSICSPIPLLISSKIEASFSGYWSTSPAFRFNQSIFQMTILGAKMTNEEYTQRMSVVARKLAALGQRYASRSLIYNNIIYGTYDMTDQDLKQGREKIDLEFYSSADATIIFNGEVVAAAVSNRDGVCFGYQQRKGALIPTTGDFNPATGALELNINEAVSPTMIDWTYANNFNKTFRHELNAHATCFNQLKARHYGSLTYKSSYRGGDMKFIFDLHTIILCVVLNMQDPKQPIAPLDTLNVISSQLSMGLIGYVDDEYTMNTVWCLNKKDARWGLTEDQIAGPEVCFVPLMSSEPTRDLFLPVIAQSRSVDGACSETGSCRRVSCQCPGDADDYECNIGTYSFGLIYGDDALSDDVFDDDDAKTQSAPKEDANFDITVKLALRMQKFLLDDPENGDIAMYEYVAPILADTVSIVLDRKGSKTALDSFNASQLSDHGFLQGWENNTWARGQSYQQLLRKSWDDVCPSCAAFVFNVISGHHRNLAINIHGVGLPELVVSGNSARIDSKVPLTMCRDVLGQQAALQALAATPPFPLINPYYQCSKTAFNALVSSLGTAVAATNFYVASAWIIIGWVLARVWIKPHLGLVGRQAKQSVIDSYEQMQGEAIVGFATAVLTKLDRLEKSVTLAKEGSGSSSQDLAELRESVALLQRVFDPSRASQASPAATSATSATFGSTFSALATATAKALNAEPEALNALGCEIGSRLKRQAEAEADERARLAGHHSMPNGDIEMTSKHGNISRRRSRKSIVDIIPSMSGINPLTLLARRGSANMSKTTPEPASDAHSSSPSVASSSPSSNNL